MASSRNLGTTLYPILCFETRFLKGRWAYFPQIPSVDHKKSGLVVCQVEISPELYYANGRFELLRDGRTPLLYSEVSMWAELGDGGRGKEGNVSPTLLFAQDSHSRVCYPQGPNMCISGEKIQQKPVTDTLSKTFKIKMQNSFWEFHILTYYSFFQSHTHIQGSAKEWSLRCVKRAPAARGNQDMGITQSRDRSLADPCICVWLWKTK